MQSQQFNTLADRLDHIESLTGNGTELVSIAHPADSALHTLRERIQNEHAQAENIKSDTTQKHVQQALNRADHIIQRYDTTPETGIAIYTGVINDELHSYVFDQTDLPAPITESQYRCANTFVTTPVKALTGPDNTYGVIAVERGRAAIGELRGESITVHHEIESQVMGKTRAGGQSAQRFARERERQTDEFFQQVAATASAEFRGDDGQPRISALLVGGTLATAKQFAETEHLNHQLQDRITGIYSVEYATEQGLRQTVNAGESEILDAEHAQAKQALDTFFSELATATNQVAYGEDNVLQAAEYGAIETLLIEESTAAPVRERVIEATEQQGGNIIRISGNTEKGTAFKDTFGGIGALLRFPIEE